MPARVAVLVNTSAGGEADGTLTTITDQLHQFGYKVTDATQASGDPRVSLEAMARRKPDAVIVYGGDGTQAAALSTLDTPVMPLPGGTLNWLSRAVMGEGHWLNLLQASLKDPLIVDLPAGRVIADKDANPRLFFLVAQLGGPTLFAKSREAIRSGIYKRAWFALRRAWSRSFDYQLECTELTRSGETDTYVAVVANTALASMVHDDAATLELAGFDVDSSVTGAVLGLQAFFDDWRHSPHVSMAVRKTASVLADRKIPALLDGEPCWVRPPLRIEACQKAARAWRAT